MYFLNGGGKGAFTPAQWIELEQQALIYKYIVANGPIPPNLLIPIRRALESAGFFVYKLDPLGTYTGLLIARSTDIILSSIREDGFLDYWPSSIAAAAVLCAASEMLSLSFVTPEHALSWCDGLSKDKVSNCYKLMQRSMEDQSRRKSIKVIPQSKSQHKSLEHTFIV